MAGEPHDDLEARAEVVVQELHGLKGYEAWAQRIAAFARQYADERVAELGMALSEKEMGK